MLMGSDDEVMNKLMTGESQQILIEKISIWIDVQPVNCFVRVRVLMFYFK